MYFLYTHGGTWKYTIRILRYSFILLSDWWFWTPIGDFGRLFRTVCVETVSYLLLGQRRRRWSNIYPELFQRLVFAVSTASSTCDVIFMNDNFERRGLLQVLSHSLIILIRFVVRSSEMFLNKHTYCLAVCIVYNLSVQHLCVTPVRLCRTRGPWTQTHRIVNPLRPDNHDNMTCIPRQLFA